MFFSLMQLHLTLVLGECDADLTNQYKREPNGLLFLSKNFPLDNRGEIPTVHNANGDSLFLNQK